MRVHPSDGPLVRLVLRELRATTADPDRRTWIENIAKSWGIVLDVKVPEPLRGDRRAANPHRQKRVRHVGKK